MSAMFHPADKTWAALVFATHLTCSALGQTGPSWSVEPAEMTLGTIPEFPMIEQDFLVWNHGETDLTISGTPVSCELCLQATLSGAIIPPGGSSTLTITFNPFGYQGPIQHAVEVFSDRSDQPMHAIPIRARVQRLFETQAGPVLFNSLFKHEQRTQVIRLRRSSTNSSELAFVRSDYPGIAADIETTSRDGEILLHIRSVPSHLEEGVTHSHLFLSANENEDPVYAVPVRCEVIPPFHVNPRRLLFDRVDREQIRMIFIQQDPQDPARLVDVRLPSRRFRVEVHPDFELPNYRITIYARGLAQLEGDVGHIELVTDREEQATERVSVVVESIGRRPQDGPGT